MSVDARKEDFEHIELFGKPALFSNSRIDRVTVPGNLYCYDLRGSDNDPGRPVTVENKVGVNHAGTVLAIEPVTIPEEGYKRLRGKINFLGEHIDIPSFCEEHGIEYLPDPRRFELRPASPDEAGLFYSQKEQDEALGTVGHMRFDHGHGGAEFWHTWWPHNGDDLNTPEFKKEFEAFVNEMREYGPLRNGRAMYDYCYSNAEKMDGGMGNSFGFIAESENYRYCLRCTPREGDYSYIYIYDKRQQELNMKKTEKPIIARTSYANGEVFEHTDPEAFLKELREELQYRNNTGRIVGAYDIDFDKREFSGVNIMDGWKTYAMRDVSTAVYHADRSQYAHPAERLYILLDKLEGKEITSAGHLSARELSFEDEICEMDDQLDFMLGGGFDVDAAFGTFVVTDQNDDWLNIYANYDMPSGEVCDTLDIVLHRGDGTDEEISYTLNAAEKEILLRKMDAYCQERTGMTLVDYSAQRMAENDAPLTEPQM